MMGFALVSQLSPAECEGRLYDLAASGFIAASANEQPQANDSEAREIWIRFWESRPVSGLFWLSVQLQNGPGGCTLLNCRIVPSFFRLVPLALGMVVMLVLSPLYVPGWCVEAARGEFFSGAWWSVPNTLMGVYFLWRLRHLRSEMTTRLNASLAPEPNAPLT